MIYILGARLQGLLSVHVGAVCRAQENVTKLSAGMEERRDTRLPQRGLRLPRRSTRDAKPKFR
jgi:hypothetical protein